MGMHEKARRQSQQDEWADEVVARLGSQEDMDRALRDALRRTPSQREETIARMADALRGAAQGLTIPGCAAAAGVPERTLREWLDLDASFAAALGAAHALAEAHGLRPGTTPTPAALQLMLNAIRMGAAWPAAATLVGISIRGFNRLRAEAPPVAALIAAAQRARGAKAAAGQRRRPAKAASSRAGYRIVRLDDPLLSPGGQPGLRTDGLNALDGLDGDTGQRD
ncbi:hypothetical protein [Streptomyces antarcticus]|uniref:hypothetical protein n=2 Tax=Streptomyces antarcticus TaxID=2996458 RepID=UPI0022724D9B|nr:hypothetical protein [Streptomyces sp. H34-S5]MCY0939993.1 hypothetical protein [Streptomyces sp. H34-AA3]MCZ4087057.1 hypothetical protein [Streptomyces sp. H34-S5]